MMAKKANLLCIIHSKINFMPYVLELTPQHSTGYSTYERRRHFKVWYLHWGKEKKLVNGHHTTTTCCFLALMCQTFSFQKQGDEINFLLPKNEIYIIFLHTYFVFVHAFGRLIPFPKFYILHRICFHLPNILSPKLHPPLPEKVHTSILWPGWYETRAYMFLNKQKLTFFNLSRLMRGHVPRKKTPSTCTTLSGQTHTGHKAILIKWG